MRLKNTLMNLIAAWGGQLVLIFVKFFTRRFFTRYLDVVYLGIDGTFSTIISTLSLAELGIGGAIAFSLYKPLANEDQETTKSLMAYYKHIYQVIGIIIGVLGLAIMPFLYQLSNDLPHIPYLRLIFFLYLCNTVLSYFCSYRTTLLNADQKKYIYLTNHYVFYIIMNIVQIVVLYVTKNFFVFISAQILFTISENLNIARIAGKKYPLLKEKNVQPLHAEIKSMIWKNTKNMAIGRVGNIIIDSSDVLILSKFLGTVTVGFYNNYQLIISSIQAILTQFTDAMLPSIGNLYAQGNKERIVDIFYVSNFLNTWIYGWVSICIINLIQPFVTIWVGEKYLLSLATVIILVLRLYIKGMRNIVNTYRTAFGLFKCERWKSVAEGILNIILSIIFVYYLGMEGVFFGTVISALVVGIWPEVLELFRDGFDLSQGRYYLRYMIYSIIWIIIGGGIYSICLQIHGGLFITFLIRAIICIIIPNVIWYLIWRKSSEMKYLFEVGKGILKRK